MGTQFKFSQNILNYVNQGYLKRIETWYFCLSFVTFNSCSINYLDVSPVKSVWVQRILLLIVNANSSSHSLW
jgi:hypothetical protein